MQEQTPYINEADLIIWACGYQTNSLPIYEMNQPSNTKNVPSKPLVLSQMKPGTQFDVDNKCRVLLKNNVALNKVFGCGIGYPVRTNDGKTIVPQSLDRLKQQ